MRRLAILLSALVLLRACSEQPSDQTTAISVIGDRNPVVSAATSQGLVAFDADGQIEPALAERWIVSDDGLHIVLRLARTNWSNHKPITATEVAHSLNDDFARAAHGRLGAVFSSIEGVDAMTDHVVDIKLKSPRPNFLQLLAAPEMGIQHNGFGTGPYIAITNDKSAAVLRPVRATDGSDDGVSDDELHARQITVFGDTAALAIARYKNGRAAAVLGGTFNDYPVAQSAQLAANQFVIDRPHGLFGLAFVARTGFASNGYIREALSMAIDRPALMKALGLVGLVPRDTILPGALDQADAPAAPDWSGASIDVRRTEAGVRVRTWSKSAATPPSVRVALPDTPGARLLFARLSADWRAIGVTAIAVAPRDQADLKLIDEIAPDDSVSWYFARLSCATGVICNEVGQQALTNARNAPTADARAKAYALVDKAYNDLVPFIPLADPFRWNLTTSQLVGLRPSPVAVHPLIRLRIPRS
jgi:peptide/nickel transport system substrate-binding protein